MFSVCCYCLLDYLLFIREFTVRLVCFSTESLALGPRLVLSSCERVSEATFGSICHRLGPVKINFKTVNPRYGR
jgi:hypothetical protein